MSRTYRDHVALLYSAPSTSYWLRSAIDALERRDPLDAMHDATLLAELQKVRVAELTEAP
jgi:hypothetical protein